MSRSDKEGRISQCTVTVTASWHLNIRSELWQQTPEQKWVQQLRQSPAAATSCHSLDKLSTFHLPQLQGGQLTFLFSQPSGNSRISSGDLGATLWYTEASTTGKTGMRAPSDSISSQAAVPHCSPTPFCADTAQLSYPAGNSALPLPHTQAWLPLSTTQEQSPFLPLPYRA